LPHAACRKSASSWQTFHQPAAFSHSPGPPFAIRARWVASFGSWLVRTGRPVRVLSLAAQAPRRPHSLRHHLPRHTATLSHLNDREVWILRPKARIQVATVMTTRDPHTVDGRLSLAVRAALLKLGH
jgi:hypothetical protein